MFHTNQPVFSRAPHALAATSRALAAFLTLALCSHAAQAQTLLHNGGFEDWVTTGGVTTPRAWNLLHPTITTKPTVYGEPVHCGDTACRVDVSGNTSEVGKQFLFAPTVAPVGELRVRFRVLYPTAANQPTHSVGGTLKAIAAGYSIPSPNTLQLEPGADSVTILPSDDWQEFTLSYAAPAGTAARLVRFNFVFAGGHGQRYYIDSVDFEGSNTASYGSLEDSNARQIVSNALSLIYDSDNHSLRELRAASEGKATGPNYLYTETASHLESPGSALFTATTRTAIDVLDGTWVSSKGFSATSTRLSAANRIGWRFVRAGAFGGSGSVQIDVYAEPGDDKIYVEPTVTPPSNIMLEEFRCPTLEYDSYIGGDEAYLLVPTAGGARVRVDDATYGHVATHGLNGQGWLGGEYPGTSALQLLAMYRKTAGSALMALDETGENKSFTATIDGITKKVTLTVAHRLPSVVGLPVPPFRRAILPCIGDWRHAAEQYRDWVRTTNLWGRAAQRTTAAWVDERPTMYGARLLPQGNGQELVPLADWDTLMTSWGQRLNPNGATQAMVPLFRDFEQHGVFAGPDYLPLRVMKTGPLGVQCSELHNETTILNNWLSVNAAGHRPMAMVAGLKWCANDPKAPTTASRKGVWPSCNGGSWTGSGANGTAYWQPTFDSNWAAANLPSPDGIVVRNRKGDNDWKAPSASWDLAHFTMDPRSTFALTTHSKLAAKMASGGLDLYLFDQMNGGGVPDNFDTTLSAPGAGRWKSAAIRSLFQNTLAAGRVWNPDMELAIEDPCEQAIDLIALQGVRASNVRRHPAPNYGEGEAVPLFPFVFGEVVRCIEWDHGQSTVGWTSSPNRLAGQVDHVRTHEMMRIARSLSAGAWFSVELLPWMLVFEFSANTACAPSAGQSMMPFPTRTDPVVLAFLSACAQTSQNWAAPYIHAGKMVRTEGLVLPPPMQVFLQPHNGNGPADPVSQPQVFDAAWEIGLNNWGLLLINVSSTASANVTLPTRIGQTTLTPGMVMKVHRNGGASALTTYTSPTTLSLAPGEVMFVRM